MPTDQLVTAGHVLKAVMELDRRGATSVLSDLEKLEPDLAEYLLLCAAPHNSSYAQSRIM